MRQSLWTQQACERGERRGGGLHCVKRTERERDGEMEKEREMFTYPMGLGNPVGTAKHES
jgi:hypothetical protein